MISIKSTSQRFFKHLLLIGAVAASMTLFTTPASAEEKKMSTRTTAAAIEWTLLPNGRRISPVVGDFKKGRHITFVKFTPGMKSAPHIHTNTYTGIVVKGTARHYQPGYPETETVLEAGSTWSIPSRVVHISECLPVTECIFALYQEDFFDAKLAK